jgi:hypothetical protein
MAALILLLLNLGASLFKSRCRLEAENAALRQQLIVLQRKVRGRVEFTNSDRLFFIQLYRWFPSILKAITTFRPETLVRWHRAGFRRYWRWKSRSVGGRPQVDADLRALIQRMSAENPLWGAPRIHGELLKLGFDVAQSSASQASKISVPSKPMSGCSYMPQNRFGQPALSSKTSVAYGFTHRWSMVRKRLMIACLFDAAASDSVPGRTQGAQLRQVGRAFVWSA